MTLSRIVNAAVGSIIIVDIFISCRGSVNAVVLVSHSLVLISGRSSFLLANLFSDGPLDLALAA